MRGEAAGCAAPFLVALTVSFPVPRRLGPWRRRVSGPPVAAGQHTHAILGGVVHTVRARRTAGLGSEGCALPPHRRRQSPRPSPVPSLSPEAPRAARPAALPSCPGVDLHVVCAVLSSPTLLYVAVMCFYAEHPCLDTCAPLTRGRMGSVWGREAGSSRGLARTPLCLG